MVELPKDYSLYHRTGPKRLFGAIRTPLVYSTFLNL